MKWRVITLLIILGLTLPVLAIANSPQPKEFLPCETVDFWVDTNGSYRYYFVSLPANYRIYINLDVTSGSDIDFYILDEDNYDLWNSDQASYAEEVKENVGSISLTFIVPSSGEWNLLFINDNWLFRKHIEGTISAYAPTPTTSTTTSSNPSLSLAGPVLLLFLAIFLLVMGVACCKKVEERQKETHHTHPYPQEATQLPPYRPSSPAQEHILRFCPYCGTPRQSSDALFCSRCGKPFSESDIN